MNIHIGTLPGLPSQARAIILIGRRSSDHLQELIRMIEFRGRAAYRIEAAADLQPRWFVGIEDVGIILGADDLQNILAAVLDKLNQFSTGSQRNIGLEEALLGNCSKIGSKVARL